MEGGRERIELKDLEKHMKQMVDTIVEHLYEKNNTINKEFAYGIVTYIVADLINHNISYTEISVDSEFNPMYG